MARLIEILMQHFRENVLFWFIQREILFRFLANKFLA